MKNNTKTMVVCFMTLLTLICYNNFGHNFWVGYLIGGLYMFLLQCIGNHIKENNE